MLKGYVALQTKFFKFYGIKRFAEFCNKHLPIVTPMYFL